MMLKGLISALKTLTIIPVVGIEPQKRYMALPWFVVVVGVIGALLAACAEGIRFLPASVAPLTGLLIAGVNYLITGGLHIDGLADTADAFGTWHSREKTLEILKDSHTGSFGAAAITLIVIWRIITSNQLSNHGAVVFIFAAPLFSRILQGFLLSVLPYARGKDGKASGFRAPLVITAILALEFTALIVAGWYYFGVLRVLLPLGCGLVMVTFLVLVSIRRIGGITGDIVGAATELFECAFLTGALAGIG